MNPNYRKGRLTEVAAGSTAIQYNRYDPLARVAAHTQRTDSHDYMFAYTYNLADGVTSIKYPSVRTVQTDYDAAGRVNQVAGGRTGESPAVYIEGAAPGQGVQYSAHGAMMQWKLGSGFHEQWSYNARLQPNLLRLGTSAGSGSTLGLEFGYGPAGGNNGNLRSQRITGSGVDLTQSYEYDALNRLEQATEIGSWSRAFGHDQYGNGWVATSSAVDAGSFTPRTSSWFDANNRLVNASLGIQYDGSGNQSQIGAHQFEYDGEGRLAKSTINSAVTQYEYDGEGRHVKKGSTVYVYDVFGQLAAAEYGTVLTESGRRYLTADHLGSVRAVTANGEPIARRDYLPYGDSPVRARCTLERQSLAESGLDYFGARYFSGVQGRFTSPDPLGGQHPWHIESATLEHVCIRGYNPLAFTDLDVQRWQRCR